MRFTCLSPFLLPAVLLVGCADSGPVTAPSEELALQYDAANAPPQSGPNVFRFDDLPGIGLGGEPNDGLAILAGFEAPISVEAICADPFNQPFVPGSDQLVFTPSGGFHEQARARSTNVVVFAYGAGIITDACQLVGAPVVATGIVTLSVNVAPNVQHFTVRGIVDLVGGGQGRLHAAAQIVFRDGFLVLDKERVTLTPL